MYLTTISRHTQTKLDGLFLKTVFRGKGTILTCPAHIFFIDMAFTVGMSKSNGNICCAKEMFGVVGTMSRARVFMFFFYM